MGNNKEIEMRRLVIKSFHMKEVILGEEFSIHNQTLIVSKNYFKDKLQQNSYVDKINIDVIYPHQHDRKINSIMDIIPISTKVLGRLGEGITHTLTGVYIMLTGADKKGNQMAEFGSSEGNLKDKLFLERPGTPGKEDIIIHVDVIFKEGLMSSRKYPLEGHRLCDIFIQEIRDIMKKLPGRQYSERHEFYDKIRPNKKRIAIVKQIAGQGAMYDNQLFSKEPSGFEGGKSIIDIGNVPIIMSPNEYRDGALRSMV
ncbi:proline reductase cluster protein PrdD [Garciella nitratireducens]|uniref:proline reductase cluster protein PrdD n=1 Tax=Garciella nitratireducens TaxID=218205 RepID=UPI000DEABEDE|nr:proline reductase cluster protein PrdD [Garciella nitratireducens]RBP46843.1 D-proline reductase (dithiol) PrdD [Garciella nitratireducens]